MLGFNNSKLFAWILYKFIYSNAIRSTRFDLKYVSRIPVPDLLKIDTLVIAESVKNVINLNEKINKKTIEFHQILTSNFKNIIITNKLKTFYNFEFNIFVEEFKKQKIDFNLNKQKEWLPFFNNYKSEINEFQKLLKKLDKEIDLHIYKLYNLTEKEVAVIDAEQNFK